ncbi:MAG: nucleoside-diphosphate kinase [Elusimicrobiota bacterium]
MQFKKERFGLLGRSFISFIVCVFMLSGSGIEYVLASSGLAVNMKAQNNSLYSGLILAEGIGSVSERFQGKTDDTVILIQDLHCNSVVQKNISDILSYIKNVYGDKFNRISVEGSWGEPDTSILGSVPKGYGIKESLIDDLIGRGLITGAEKFAIENPGEVLLAGIEDRNIYLKNFSALCDAGKYQGRAIDAINIIKNYLEEDTKKLYAKDLTNLIGIKKRYEEGKIGLNEYLKYLEDESKRVNIDLNNFKEIKKLLKVYEKGEEFRGVSNMTLIQRDAFVVEKSLNKYLSDDESVKLEEYRLRKSARYYDYLLLLIRNKNIIIGNIYPKLERYLSYIELSSGINAAVVLDERHRLEYGLETTMAGNKKIENIVYLNYFTNLLKGFIANEITSNQVERFNANMDEFMRDLSIYLESKGSDYDGILININNTLSAMRNFYKYADIRNSVLVKNLLKKSNGLDVVLAGGYHTNGMGNELRARGISYMVITPGICDAELDDNYKKRLKAQSGLINDDIKINKDMLNVWSVFINAGIDLEGQKQIIKSMVGDDLNLYLKGLNLPEISSIDDITERSQIAAVWLAFIKKHIEMNKINAEQIQPVFESMNKTLEDINPDYKIEIKDEEVIFIFGGFRQAVDKERFLNANILRESLMNRVSRLKEADGFSDDIDGHKGVKSVIMDKINNPQTPFDDLAALSKTLRNTDVFDTYIGLIAVMGNELLEAWTGKKTIRGFKKCSIREMIKENIEFGTSGWRSEIGNGFNQLYIAIVFDSIAGYLGDETNAGRFNKDDEYCLLGFDTRDMGYEAVRIGARILAGYGIKSIVAQSDDQYLSTPQMAYMINQGEIIVNGEICKIKTGAYVTASHNVKTDNGIKIFEKQGGSMPAGSAAPKQMTDAVTAKAKTFDSQMKDKKGFRSVKRYEEALSEGLVVEIKAQDALGPYMEYVKRESSTQKLTDNIFIDVNHGGAGEAAAQLTDNVLHKNPGLPDGFHPNPDFAHAGAARLWSIKDGITINFQKEYITVLSVAQYANQTLKNVSLSLADLSEKQADKLMNGETIDYKNYLLTFNPAKNQGLADGKIAANETLTKMLNNETLSGLLEIPLTPYAGFFIDDKSLNITVDPSKAMTGIVVDCDADRMALVQGGAHIDANKIMALLSYYSIKSVMDDFQKIQIENGDLEKFKKEYCDGNNLNIVIGRTIATTQLIDAIVSYFNKEEYKAIMSGAGIRLNIEVKEVQVGFKYFAPFIDRKNGQKKIIICGESSAHLAVTAKKGNSFDDGVFVGLVLLDLMKKQNITDILGAYEEIQKDVEFYSNTTEKKVVYKDADEQAEVKAGLSPKIKKEELQKILTKYGLSAGLILSNEDPNEGIDGVRLSFPLNKSWLLFRMSGTEAAGRVYSEAQTPEEAELLNEIGFALMGKEREDALRKASSRFLRRRFIEELGDSEDIAFAMIKPDGLEKSSSIISDIEETGFTVLFKENTKLDKKTAGEFYAEHKGKQFYNGLIDYMCESDVCILVLKMKKGKTRAAAWDKLRKKIGKTDGTEKDTLRFKYKVKKVQYKDYYIEKNKLHCSDSQEAVKRELCVLFRNGILFSEQDRVSNILDSLNGILPGDGTASLIQGIRELMKQNELIKEDTIKLQEFEKILIAV